MLDKSFWKNLEHDDIFWCKRGEFLRIYILADRKEDLEKAEENLRSFWSLPKESTRIQHRDFRRLEDQENPDK